MRDFLKDIENIRNKVLHEYNKEYNIITKNIKIHKKKKPAWNSDYRFYGTWNSDYRFYGTIENNLDQYTNVIEQLSPEILNRLDIANIMIINLANKEFEKYFNKHFYNFLSINNIKIEFKTETSWFDSFTKKVFSFTLNDKRMTESQFAEYLKEKYYYTNTLKKINNICNPLELVMNK